MRRKPLPLGRRLDRKSVRAALLAAALLGSGCVGTGCGHAPPAPAAAAPIHPLGAEIDLDRYAVLPPAGLTLTIKSVDSPKALHELYTWTIPKRPDGSREFFQVEILHPYPGFVVDDARTLLRAYSAGNARRHRGFAASPPKPFPNHGFAFLRSDWTGVLPATHTQNRGFVCITSDGQTAIEISANDAEPYIQGEFAVCESAALTFRKQ